MFRNALAAAWRFARRWQMLVWLPSAVAVALAAFYVLRAVDPSASTDAGELWGLLIVTLGVLLAGFSAWLLRTVFSLEFSDKDERELIDHGCGIVRNPNGVYVGIGQTCWHAIAVYAIDRASWLATFWLCLRVFVPSA